MDFYSFKYIIQFCLILSFANFVIGYPLVHFLIKSGRKSFAGWSQIFGATLIFLLLGLSYYLGFYNFFRRNFIYFLIVMFCFFLFLLLKRTKKLLFINIITTKELLVIFTSAVLILLFILPQNYFPSFVPSYNVSHDAIGYLSLSKLIGDKGNVTEYCNQNNKLFPCSLISSGYPLGFTLYLSLFKTFFLKVDYYNISHLISLFLYSLTIVPLIAIFKLFIKNKRTVGVVSFLSLVAYLPIQYVNQSFYSQISLSFLLFSAIYIFILIVKRNKFDLVLALVLSLLLSAGLYVYSLTIFFWIIPLVVMMVIYMTIIRDIDYIVFSKNLLIIAGLTIVFSFPYFRGTISLFNNMLFSNRGSESSFFEAKGNTIGYPNFTTAFSSWLDLDFRINTAGKLRLYSYIIFSLQLLLIFITLLKKRLLNRNKSWLFFIFLLSLIIPILVSRYLLNSPYYYGKTLFYGSFVFSIVIYCSIVISLLEKKRDFLGYILSLFLLLIMLNNSYKSFNYFGHPPVLKFLSISEVVDFLNKNEVKNVVAVDNEDWLKYFLVDHGSCVTYPLSFPCGLETVDYDKSKDSYHLLSNNIYMIGHDYLPKITNLKEGKQLYSNDYYGVYSF